MHLHKGSCLPSEVKRCLCLPGQRTWKRILLCESGLVGGGGGDGLCCWPWWGAGVWKTCAKVEKVMRHRSPKPHLLLLGDGMDQLTCVCEFPKFPSENGDNSELQKCWSRVQRQDATIELGPVFVTKSFFIVLVDLSLYREKEKDERNLT